MSAILTEEMVKKAIMLATPTIKAILDEPVFVWGPRYVAVVVTGWNFRVERVVPNDFPEWDPQWGEYVDLLAEARKDIRVAKRAKMDSAEILRKPWVLEPEDSLLGGAVVSDGELAVAVCGAKMQINEGIANLILSLIHMGCRMLFHQMLNEDNVRTL